VVVKLARTVSSRSNFLLTAFHMIGSLLIMKLRTLSVFAAVALLAACADDAKNTGAAGGGASTQQAAPMAPKSMMEGVAAGSVEDFLKNVGDRVFFDFDKSNLTDEGKATLDKQVAWLKKYGQWSITIEGHCDERGTREYNLALGERRANSVKKYLAGAGVADSRLKTISYGKERPAVQGSNEAAWAQNRRGVTVLGQ
jgi:peptidoglycan-associated lipoprotein